MPNLLADAAKKKEKIVPSKPQTAVTYWIDRICHPNRVIDENDLNGFIIELVHTINLQSTGPKEASRAIRKQLKHGRIVSQHRALLVLRALVLNGDDRFKSAFFDAKFIDCIKTLVGDPKTDRLVKRRTMILLKEWEGSFESIRSPDQKTKAVSNLFRSCGGDQRLESISLPEPDHSTTIRSMITGIEQSYITVDPKKRRTSNKNLSRSLSSRRSSSINENARVTKDESSKDNKNKNKNKRKKKFNKKVKKSPIDQRYRKDEILPINQLLNLKSGQTLILQTVETASQRAKELVNCLEVVHRTGRSESNVQELLQNVKVSQRTLVRYIGFATEQDSNSEHLGILISTNNQIVSSIELYELVSRSVQVPDDRIDGLIKDFKDQKFEMRSSSRTYDDDEEDDEEEEVEEDDDEEEETSEEGDEEKEDFDSPFRSPTRTGGSNESEGMLMTISTDLLGLDFNSPTNTTTTTASTSSSPGINSDLQTPLTPDPISKLNSNNSQNNRTMNDPKIVGYERRVEGATLSDFSDFEGSDDDDDDDDDESDENENFYEIGKRKGEGRFINDDENEGSGSSLKENLRMEMKSNNPYHQFFNVINNNNNNNNSNNSNSKSQKMIDFDGMRFFNDEDGKRGGGSIIISKEVGGDPFADPN